MKQAFQFLFPFIVTMAFAQSAYAQDELSAINASYRTTTTKAVTFLMEKGIAKDGSFSKQLSPAVTALCLKALLEHKVPVGDARIQRSLKYLESQIKPDGGIYAEGKSSQKLRDECFL